MSTGLVISSPPSAVRAQERSAALRRLTVRVAPWLVPLAGSIVVLMFLSLEALMPLRTAIRIGPDEGYEGAKTVLCLHGYQLYSDVWNDQPPLHTYLLTKIVRLTDQIGVDRPSGKNNVAGAHSILGPRLVSVVGAGLLLVALFGLVLRGLPATSENDEREISRSLLVATVAAFLLLASPSFLELSSSCMVEIPALAPAVAALWVLADSAESKVQGPKSKVSNRDSGLKVAELSTIALAGVLFGISFQIKFINAPLLLLAAWLIAQEVRSRLRSEASARQGAERGVRSGMYVRPMIGRLALFGGCIALTFVAINWLAGGGSLALQFKQSWQAHFAGAKSFEYGSPADRPFQWSLLLRNWDITLPALIGVAVCLRKAFGLHQTTNQRGGEHFSMHRNSNSTSPPALPQTLRPGKQRLSSEEKGGRTSLGWLFPAAWLVMSFAIFGTHQPWWTYYYLHNLVPLCWCAAIGIVAIGGFVLRSLCCTAHWKNGRLAAVALGAYLLCAVPWMVARVYLQVRDIRQFPKIYNSLIIQRIARLRPWTQFLYTDEPIYSFHTGIPMPPQHAVVALKRFWSGDMTNERIAADLSALKPGIVLLRNDSQPRPFDGLLNSAYRLIYLDGQHRLYVRADIAKRAR